MLTVAVSLFLNLVVFPERLVDLHSGQGSAISSGDRFTIHYRVLDTSGKELANSELRGLPFSKELGDGHDGYFDRWVSGMSVGGLRKVMIDSKHLPVSLRASYGLGPDLAITLRLIAVKKKSPR